MFLNLDVKPPLRSVESDYVNLVPREQQSLEIPRGTQCTGKLANHHSIQSPHKILKQNVFKCPSQTNVDILTSVKIFTYRTRAFTIKPFCKILHLLSVV